MDFDELSYRAMEGERLSTAEMEEVIEQVRTTPDVDATTIIAETGRNHPDLLATFAEELGDVGYIDDEFLFEQFIDGVVEVIDEEPSTYDDLRGVLQNGIASAPETAVSDVFHGIERAAEAGESVSNNVIGMCALRVATTRGGKPVTTGASMFEALVSGEAVDNAEAFDCLVGVVETGRDDLVRAFGASLVDIILEENVPDDADLVAARRVFDEFSSSFGIRPDHVEQARERIAE